MDDLKLPGPVSASFSVELTPDAVAFLRAVHALLPKICPSCGFTHPSALWRRVGEALICMKCGEDFDWPSVIG